MKRKLPGITTAWMLMLTCSVLFILLVISKQSAFWNQRRASIHLVSISSTSSERLLVFNKVYVSNLKEQIDIFEFAYSPSLPKNENALDKILSEASKNDKLLIESEKLLKSPDQQELLNKLKLLSKEKSELLNQLIQSFNNGNPAKNRNIYDEKLSPNYEQFQNINSQLLASIKASNQKLMNGTGDRITNLSKLSILISIALIVILVALGFTLTRIVKNDQSIRHALEESETKYRTLTEKTHDIIEKCDAEGRFVFVNESFKKRFEYNDEELSKLTITDLLEDGPIRFDQQAPQPNIITNVQRVFRSKSGKKIYLEGTIFLEYKSGIFEGAIGFYNDVTEKKQLEESLKASELKFRNFFNLAPIPIWVVDPQTFKFISVNKAASKHYGYCQDEFLNMTVFDIRQGRNAWKERKDVERVKEQTLGLSFDKNVKFNFYHLKKNSEKMEVEIYTSPILLNDKVCILAISIDVTERNQFENKITKAIIKTQEDERYEIGSELHDNVCQILAAAKMSLGMIKPSLNPYTMKSYNQSYDAIMLATTEIRNLSHRLAPAFFDNTKLETAFESLIKSFNLTEAYNVSIYFDKTSKEIQISQDLQLNLYRILQEQLRNIIQYAHCTNIEISGFIKKEKFHLSIADNGVGFDMNNANNGIGLANMKRRTELFSGEFYLNSAKGKGCEVIVVIPIDQTK